MSVPQPIQNLAISCVYGVGLLLLLVQPAHAYLEPVSTSLALQLLVGMLVGFAVWARGWWKKTLSFFTGKPVEDGKEPKNDNSTSSTH